MAFNSNYDQQIGGTHDQNSESVSTKWIGLDLFNDDTRPSGRITKWF